MDKPHESEPESDLTDEEMTRLEHMREHLRYCGLLIQPDHTEPVAVVIIRDGDKP
jgi:hypothetical protein